MFDDKEDRFAVLLRHYAQLNYELEKASYYNQRDEINRLIELGATNWKRAVLGASLGGHLDLVKFFIEEKGASCLWQKTGPWAIIAAKEGNHQHIIDYFVSKGSKGSANDSGISYVYDDSAFGIIPK